MGHSRNQEEERKEASPAFIEAVLWKNLTSLIQLDLALVFVTSGSMCPTTAGLECWGAREACYYFLVCFDILKKMELHFRALDYVITYPSISLACIYIVSDTDQTWIWASGRQ